MSKASPAARYETIQAEAMLTASLLVLSCTYEGGWMERDRGEREGEGVWAHPRRGMCWRWDPFTLTRATEGTSCFPPASSGLLR